MSRRLVKQKLKRKQKGSRSVVINWLRKGKEEDARGDDLFSSISFTSTCCLFAVVLAAVLLGLPMKKMCQLYRPPQKSFNYLDAN